MTIDELIEIVAPKLPQRMPKQRYSIEMISGKDLKLTGVKDVKGEKIEDEKMYKMKVPVKESIDHKKKLRMEYLQSGELGVRNYIARYFGEEVAKTAIKTLDPRKNGR